MSDVPTKREIQAAFGQRVYEYLDDDGVTYYSFTRATAIISPPIRLTLQGRVGTHIIQFLVRLRRMSQAFQTPQDEG